MPRWGWIALAAAVAAAVVAVAIKRAPPAIPFVSITLKQCYDDHEVKPEDRTAIIQAANDVLARVKGGDVDVLIHEAHPLFETAADRNAVGMALKSSAGVLSGVPLPLKPIDIKLVTGNLERGTKVDCDSEKPNGFVYGASGTGAELRALVTFRPVIESSVYTFHVELWKHEGRWLLAYFKLTPRVHNGRDSAYYVQAGDDALKKGDRFAALVLYDVADSLATISSNIFTREESAIAPKRQPLREDAALSASLKRWNVDGDTYEIADLDAAADALNASVFALFVEFESKHPGDALALFNWLKATHPILPSRFDAVIFVWQDGKRMQF